MSKLLTREQIAEQAFIRDGVANDSGAKSVEVDRSFEMPKALYGATVALYLGFIAIMAVGFPSPGMILPMAIFAIFIVAGFGVPALWARLEPKASQKTQKTMANLMSRGIMTNTGLLSGKDAAVQMLILPVLIVCWGITTVTIAAIVS